VLYREGRVVLRSRVVVGLPSWATPIFATQATGVLFHPPWNVPTSIARRELIAKARQDPGYLVREGIEVVSTGEGPSRVLDPAEVDWDRPATLRLRQRPGPRNALGLLKIQMPNRYAVFLHDTPQREYFARDQRALSHGCVRVESARELAAALLPGGAAQVEERLAAAHTRQVSLRRPVPVRLRYRTAWVEEGGVTHFRADVYGYDADLARALRLRASAAGANNARSSTRPRGDHG
jgi:L,D-transpeptidase YcbB